MNEFSPFSSAWAEQALGQAVLIDGHSVSIKSTFIILIRLVLSNEHQPQPLGCAQVKSLWQTGQGQDAHGTWAQ